MKPNIHVHLSASDLAKSAAFYEALFGAPVKVKPGYRKFLPTFAPLNLAGFDPIFWGFATSLIFTWMVSLQTRPDEELAVKFFPDGAAEKKEGPADAV